MYTYLCIKCQLIYVYRYVIIYIVREGKEPLRKEVRKMEDMKINLTVDDIITIIEYLNDFKNVVSDCDDDDIAIISNLVDKLRSISL